MLLATALPALTFCALCTLFAWRRSAWYSPAALWSGFALGNLAALWAVILWDVHLPEIRVSPMPSIRLEGHFLASALLCCALAAMGPLATLGLSPARRGEAAAALSARLRGFADGPWAGGYAVFAAGLCAAHLALIDREALWLNSEYLSLTDTARNGLDGAFGAFLNNAVRPLAMPAFLPAALRPRGARRVLLAAVCLYALAFSLALFSRFLMVYLFIYLLGRILAEPGPRRSVPGALARWAGRGALGAAILAAFLIAMAGRGEALQGLGAVGRAAGGVDWELAARLVPTFLTTTFDGGLSFANALRLGPVYDPEYQILSFSPFPSFLDGFSETQQKLAPRINAFVPVSAYGELAHFHWGWAALFGLIAAGAVRQMTLGVFRHHDAATAALYPVFLLCLMKFQTYSLRTSLRLFLAIALISLLACLVKRARAGRARGAEGGGAGLPAAA